MGQSPRLRDAFSTTCFNHLRCVKCHLFLFKPLPSKPVEELAQQPAGLLGAPPVCPVPQFNEVRRGAEQVKRRIVWLAWQLARIPCPGPTDNPTRPPAAVATEPDPPGCAESGQSLRTSRTGRRAAAETATG